MLYTYPSNRLENLSAALDTLLNNIERPVLASDVILVQHPGMQHWLSMELAKRSQHQLCMNAIFPLPVRYFWDLIRLIIGKEIVPARSVYSREILAWRIYQILKSEDVCANSMCHEPTSYWQDQPSHLQDRRRFQLAEQQADLYEQYLMFRPEWITEWENTPAEHWQAFIWQKLVAEDPHHPLALMQKAIAQINQPAHPLPSHFFIFGINALAPIWLDFLSHVSEQTATDIHLLYLNPSAEHWDDLQSEKQRISQLLQQTRKATDQQRAGWINPDSDDHWAAQASNPLLTSLGQQGQAFVRLLSDFAHYDTHIFSQGQNDSRLGHLQNDLLTATDGRKQPTHLNQDNSLMVSSAHSAFREVQGLHDWLLHQFNEDPSLTPKDVLVMCPNVEDYAPYIQAVFARSFSSDPESTPPLPCSIADRNLKDADPSVAAFLDLLTLPDARFEVNKIISWLRVPAIAHKFSLTADNLQTISRWLVRANVHWGLDANHKQQWLNGEVTNHFTWQQGLDRLLLGFAFGDEDCFVDDVAFMHDVEGSDALLLGKLCHIIEQLQSVRSELTKARTPSQWQRYLIDQLQIALLSDDSSFARSNQYILKAINDFTDFAHAANLKEVDIPLSVVRHVFDNAFASPEQTGSQFMAGQITVCSMVPMRSIPFRIVAILGLNDGQFPRSRPPLGFDLMAQEKPKLGDRSRRGDDRYLFLEAIMSARDALYLSYQGFDIQKNEPKPPSLVLEELFDYLIHAYGFDKSQDIRTLPLQPFSPKNYQGQFPSFDARWHSMNKQADESPNLLPALTDLATEWQLTQWVSFLQHPSKYFAQKRLGMYLEADGRMELEDSEPFHLNHLDRYQFQSQTIAAELKQQPEQDYVAQQLAASAWPLNNQLPKQLEQWQNEADEFIELLTQHQAQTIEHQHQVIDLQQLTLSADLPITSEGKLVRWRMANPNAKDMVDLWLHHLAANALQPTNSFGLFRGPKDSHLIIHCQPVSNAKAELQLVFEQLKNGLNQPLFLPAQWLVNMLQGKDDEKAYATMWEDSFNGRGLVYDDYINFFWQQRPDYEQTLANLRQTYGSFLAHTQINTWEQN